MVRIGSYLGQGRVGSAAPADLAPITLNSPADTDVSELQKRILDLLSGGGAYFFRQLVDALRTTESAADTVDSAVTTALWELVWLGHIGNDTVAPLRALLSDTTRTTTSHRSPRRVPRARPYRGMARASTPARTGPATASGRWFQLPGIEPDPPTIRHTPRLICCSNDTASSPAVR